jgi:L-iditol 2-dehydrogenase
MQVFAILPAAGLEHGWPVGNRNRFLTGIHSTPLVFMDGSAMRRKELTIFNVRRSNHETREALELLHAVDRCLHTREIEHIDEAFALASQYRDGVGKMIVRP